MVRDFQKMQQTVTDLFQRASSGWIIRTKKSMFNPKSTWQKSSLQYNVSKEIKTMLDYDSTTL